MATPASSDFFSEGQIGAAIVLVLPPGAPTRARGVQDLVPGKDKGGGHPWSGGHLERISSVGENPRRHRGGRPVLSLPGRRRGVQLSGGEQARNPEAVRTKG